MIDLLRRSCWRGTISCLALSSSVAAWGASPGVEDALKLVPVQKDVEYDRPTAAEIAQLTIKAEQVGNGSGWVVRDAAGQILRRFVDTNGDNVVDQWCYFAAGLEVYRDIDENFNGKADQYRWLNTGGTRWGIDTDEDGRIDRWKQISPEEVTAEIVRALADRDTQRFNRLLLTSTELETLGVGKNHQQALTALLQDAPGRFKNQLSAQSSPLAAFVSTGTKLKWLDFGGTLPGLVPAGTDGSTKDIIVYENVLAMVEVDGRHEQIPIGTLVRVDQSWRVIDAPNEASFFYKGQTPQRPDLPNAPGLGDEKLQELIKKIETIDERISRAAQADVPALNAERADVVEQLALASNGQERQMWYRQLADTVSVAGQSGLYPAGVERLKNLAEKLLEQDEDLSAYVFFRYLTADYYTKIQDPGAKFDEVQKEWLANLQQFVAKYAKTNDAAEAMLQLGIAEEFSGNDEGAKQWYLKAASNYPQELPPVRKATGAVARLNSVGKPLALKATTIDGKPFEMARAAGKVVVLHYWASWCQPFRAEVPQLAQLQAKYARDLLIIGVNLDDNRASAEQFLRENKLPWTQLWETGGLDSPLANTLGIVQVPTMMLIDKTGKVVDRNIHVTDLDKEIGNLVK